MKTEFETVLATAFPVSNRSAEEIKDFGLRAMRISGDASEYFNLDVAHLMKNAMPSDTVLVDYEGIPHFSYPTNGSYYDQYLMIFASKEWAKLAHGGIIPEIEVIFSHIDPIDRNSALMCKVEEISNLPSNEDNFSNLNLSVNKEKIIALIDMVLNPTSSYSFVKELAQSIKSNMEGGKSCQAIESGKEKTLSRVL